MQTSPVDRLVVAIVQIDDVSDLIAQLIERGFGATRINAAGGFLRRENAAVLVAVQEDQVPAAMTVIRATCRTRNATWLPTLDDGAVGLFAQPVEVEVGGAVVFVLPVETTEFLNRPAASAKLRE